MKKKLTILIFSLLMAVWFFTRQPELCIETGGYTYNLYEVDGYVYSMYNLDTEKLIDERLFNYTFIKLDFTGLKNNMKLNYNRRGK